MSARLLLCFVVFVPVRADAWSCWRWLFKKSAPEEAPGRPPRAEGRDRQEEFNSVFRQAGLDAEKAVLLARRIEVAVDEPLSRLRDARGAELEAILAELDSDDLLKSSGHHIDRSPLPSGRAVLRRWAGDEASLQVAYDLMATHSELIPGRLLPPRLVQGVSGAGGVLEGLRTPVVGDGNSDDLFRDQALLYVELYFHLCRRLRSYAGLTGPAASMSRWARGSGVPYEIDREADIFARLRESYGDLPERFRKRYPSRSKV